MGWPKWRHTLEESKRLAVRAIDEYNSSNGRYADFVNTMVRAWLYLLQAEFKRHGVDNRYRGKEGKPIVIDGEPKLWDTAESAKNRFTDPADPVRRNLELFIVLRNKIEHRYEHELKAVAGGRAHALVINFEKELCAQFGDEHSLADRLRFPLFVESITAPDKRAAVKASRALKAARAVIAKFDADLGSDILDDDRYDFRVRLVPMVGPKSDADAVFEFVKFDELTEEERQTMTQAGRAGKVVTKVKSVPVSASGQMLPKRVVAEVRKRVPFEFNVNLHTRLWKHFGVHPLRWANPDGGVTVAEYCLPNEPTRQYVYTQAWVEKIVREIGTPEKFEAFFKVPPRMKVADLDSVRAARADAGRKAGMQDVS